MSANQRSVREVWACFRRYAYAIGIATGITTPLAMATPWLVTHGMSVVWIPAGVLSGLLGSYGVIGAINRMMDNGIYGWPDFKHVCAGCMKRDRQLDAIAADRDELREALAILQLPESR